MNILMHDTFSRTDVLDRLITHYKKRKKFKILLSCLEDGLRVVGWSCDGRLPTRTHNGLSSNDANENVYCTNEFLLPPSSLLAAAIAAVK